MAAASLPPVFSYHHLPPYLLRLVLLLFTQQQQQLLVVFLLCLPLAAAADATAPTPPQSLLNAAQYASNSSTTAPLSVGVGSVFFPTTARNYPALLSNNSFFQLLFLQWPPDSNDTQQQHDYCMAGVRYVKKTPKSLMWSFTTQPLQVPRGSWCNLTFAPDGVLSLHNGGAAPAWRSNNTTTTPASNSSYRLFLDNTGNLMVLGSTPDPQNVTNTNNATSSNSSAAVNVIYWESFRENSFFILPSGKRFTTADVLFTRNPLQSTAVPDVHEFNTPGDFAMKLSAQGDSLLLFKYDDSMFVYYSLSLPPPPAPDNYVQIGDAIDVYNSSAAFLGFVGSDSKNITPIPATAYRAAFFQTTGDLKFNYGKDNLEFFNTELGSCVQPMFCGSDAEYKLCKQNNDNSATCSCAEGFREEGYSCVAYDGVYNLNPIPVFFYPHQELTDLHLNISVPKDCADLCNNTASCNAALHDANTSSCALFPVLYTVMQQPTTPDASSQSTQLMFLKITSPPHKRRKNLPALIVPPIVAAIALLACCYVFATLRRKRRKAEQERFLRQMLKLPPRYSFKDLQVATKNFATKLGRGAYGSVYEGEIEGVKVAVKKIEDIASAAGDGEERSLEQFKAEVATIGSVSHVHLVTLRGFCMEGPWRMLVYDFMENGSLDRWLFAKRQQKRFDDDNDANGGGRQRTSYLDWETRCKIAVQTAKGLEYLHHESATKIVHCDVKPENILLDADFNAKVADFGLAKLLRSGGGGIENGADGGARRRRGIEDEQQLQEVVTEDDELGFPVTTLKGTRGYLAPEWQKKSIVTAKSDVFSYGVVLLEMISGRRSLDGPYLPAYARRLFESASASAAGGGGSACAADPEDEQQDVDLEAEESMEAAVDLEAASNHQQVAAVVRMKASMVEEKLLDPALRGSAGEARERSVERMSLVALACVRVHPESRPSMAMVVQMLEGLADERLQRFFVEYGGGGSNDDHLLLNSPPHLLPPLTSYSSSSATADAFINSEVYPR